MLRESLELILVLIIRALFLSLLFYIIIILIKGFMEGRI